MTSPSELTAISPLDGRYKAATKVLGEYFSEYALIRARIIVECEYLCALAEEDGIDFTLSASEIERIKSWKNVTVEDAQKVKEIEKETNHDVKAVEYFLRKKMEAAQLEHPVQFIHFALTSEDVNSIAYGLLLRDTLQKILLPSLDAIYESLVSQATQYAETPLLARTHGQSASSTTFGKEMRVFAERLKRQREMLVSLPLLVKCGGATGNWNAHLVAYPSVDWIAVMKKFIESFNSKEDEMCLSLNLTTTQIEPHDTYAELFDTLRRTNTILIDFSQDIWRYISDGLILQKRKEHEIGSSTMPHKVNPIDFENAEGNLGVASALADFFSRKLPISRLQRDLSDSTVERAFGEMFGHSLVAYKALLKGLEKISVSDEAMRNSLEMHPEVLTEAIQTILRREKIPNAYELLKDFSRGEKIDVASIARFIETLPISDKVKEELKALTPVSYVGYADRIAKDDIV